VGWQAIRTMEKKSIKLTDIKIPRWGYWLLSFFTLSNFAEKIIKYKDASTNLNLVGMVIYGAFFVLMLIATIGTEIRTRKGGAYD